MCLSTFGQLYCFNIMPTYTFRDKNTGEVFDKFMKISEKSEFLAANPNLESVLTAPGFTLQDGKKRPDDGFIDLMKNIRQKAIGGKHLSSRHF